MKAKSGASPNICWPRPMRLMEVGTKQQSLGHKETAYDLFNQAYDLYCLFWGLNMNMLNVTDVKWVKDNVEDVKQLTAQSQRSR